MWSILQRIEILLFLFFAHRTFGFSVSATLLVLRPEVDRRHSFFNLMRVQVKYARLIKPLVKVQ